MIVNNIIELRKEKNITQNKLASDLNVSRQTIISLEENINKISLELAFKISNYFNKDIGEVFKDIEMKNELNDKLDTISKIQQRYGRNTIIIKKNYVFRCKTKELERGPLKLLNYILPYYGKMKLFIVIDDLVYELIPSREYENKNDKVIHTIGKQVDIDPSCIDFNALTWQDKKKKSR